MTATIARPRAFRFGTTQALRKNWYLWVAALATAGYPLISVLSVVLGVAGSNISIGYRACALLYTISAGIYLFKHRRLSLGLFGVGYLVFWLLYSMRLLFETMFRFEELSQPVADYFLFAYMITLLPSLVCFVRLSNYEARASAKILWSLCLVATIGIVLTYVFVGTGGAVSFRFSLRTLNPISMGSLGATLAVMSLFILRDTSRNMRIAALIASLIGVSILLVAASRGAIIAFLFVVLSMILVPLINKRGNLSRTHAKAAILLALALATIAIPLIDYVETNYQFSVASGIRALGTSADQSGTLRLQMFRGAWDQFLGSPLIGDSLEERSTKFYPHNNILEAFMATGLLGGVLLVGLYVAAFFSSIRLIAYRGSYSWIGAITLLYMMLSLSSGVVWGSSALFCFMALTARNVRVAADERAA